MSMDKALALEAALRKHPRGAWIAALAKVVRDYENESDRAAALLAAAMLDFQLGEVIREIFVNDKAVFKEMLGNSRPLATFSARIDLLYYLGYLSPFVRRALHQVREIRNEFAHHPDVIDFDRPDIAAKCKTLFDDVPDDPMALQWPKPRDRFLSAVGVCLMSVRFATKDVKRPAVPGNI